MQLFFDKELINSSKKKLNNLVTSLNTKYFNFYFFSILKFVCSNSANHINNNKIKFSLQAIKSGKFKLR